MELIHIHGFKCAGTTLEKILNREYEDLLLVESSNGGQRLFYNDIPKEILNVKAISSHLLAPSQGREALQICLIRDPIERLVSAWRFQSNVVKDIEDNLKQYISKYKNSILSNYQSKLLSCQKKSGSFSSGWDIDLDFDFLFGDNFFVGTVERFDESMVIIEERLKHRNININLSYPNKANTTSNYKKDNKIKKIDKFCFPAVDIDLWLIKKVNYMMDEEIKSISDFDEKLSKYHERCKESSFQPKKSEVIYI